MSTEERNRLLILRSLERQEARRRIVKEELAKTNDDIIVLRPKKSVRRIQLRKRGKDETKELAEAKVETKKVEETITS